MISHTQAGASWNIHLRPWILTVVQIASLLELLSLSSVPVFILAARVILALGPLLLPPLLLGPLLLGPLLLPPLLLGLLLLGPLQDYTDTLEFCEQMAKQGMQG